ncbi:MAG TPA: PaaI family thioesterase [Candidatus Binatia bacterium]
MSRSRLLDAVAERKNLLIDYVPHSVALGMVVLDAKPGEAWIKIPYDEKLVGNPATGVIHGGVITTLLDSTAGVAVMTALPDLRSIATLDLRIDYMKPATPGRDVIGHCRCYKLTRHIAFVHGSAYHEDPHDPIATAAMTFMLGANQAPPPAPAVQS